MLSFFFAISKSLHKSFLIVIAPDMRAPVPVIKGDIEGEEKDEK